MTASFATVGFATALNLFQHTKATGVVMGKYQNFILSELPVVHVYKG